MNQLCCLKEQCGMVCVTLFTHHHLLKDFMRDSTFAYPQSRADHLSRNNQCTSAKWLTDFHRIWKHHPGRLTLFLSISMKRRDGKMSLLSMTAIAWHGMNNSELQLVLDDMLCYRTRLLCVMQVGLFLASLDSRSHFVSEFVCDIRKTAVDFVHNRFMSIESYHSRRSYGFHWSPPMCSPSNDILSAYPEKKLSRLSMNACICAAFESSRLFIASDSGPM